MLFCLKLLLLGKVNDAIQIYTERGSTKLTFDFSFFKFIINSF